MTVKAKQAQPQDIERNWRFYVGAFLFILANLLWLIALVVLPFLGLSQPVTTLLFGLSLVGGPESLTLASVAIMGKENMVYLMGRISSFFKRSVQWEDVSRRRYRIGLLLWIGSAMAGLLLFYLFPSSLRNGNQLGWGFYASVGADIAFIISILVMGAPFWAKFAAIFDYDAQISEAPAPSYADKT